MQFFIQIRMLPVHIGLIGGKALLIGLDYVPELGGAESVLGNLDSQVSLGIAQGNNGNYETDENQR